ncbi:flavin-containing amine oxidoreductase-domain containing protein [Kalaharituber pfeilii]|nr:flavin-containing amine oxidoreductase-domain containing protein [Kalaharituber pfeilii]
MSSVEEPAPDVSAKRKPSRSLIAATPTVRTVPDRTIYKGRSDFRPKTSIPQNISAEEYAKQCCQAAINSRLSPFVLHPGEYQMLREYINHLQVTIYLNIRNGILRLWQRNPLVSVTREEAAGCAKDYRFFDVADIAYEWLIRNGYINFGCIEVPNSLSANQITSLKRKRIVVVGAGIAGLGASRQLEGLFSQFGREFGPSEGPVEIIVLEGRGRIGGRVYSHPLHDQDASKLGDDKRATADLGASIITGFDNGNPLTVLIRGQLALNYHSLHDNSLIFDSDGTVVDKTRDALTERLYNDILDRVAVFKKKPTVEKTVEGDKELIEAGKDPVGEGGRLISKIEENEVVELPPMPPSPPRSGGSPFSAEVDRLTGKPTSATGSSARVPVVEQLRKLKWEVKECVAKNATFELKPQGSDPQHPILGKTMDAVLEQYQKLTTITPLDLRLINWHYANLEYANAANVDKLSLGSWDQDDGNEFRGAHAMLIGGYTQVARGLWLSPRKLNVRTKHVVKKIKYHDGEQVRVECENGTVINADKVVVTLPLGVLKAGTVEFDPPFPEWKQGAINRLGYGLLNKIVLVFNEVFWDAGNDMFGLLRDPIGDPMKQASYEQRRGRFYLFWNCTEACGRPMLVALMAGEAALQAEAEDEESIIREVMAELSKIYPSIKLPQPVETIITRWEKDVYSRGSYSYVGPEATGDDYNLLAKPVGDSLFFAGEHTCGTHPATVHGAYISGLKVAGDVMNSLLGPIKVPSPLIPPKPKYEGVYASVAGQKRKAERSAVERARELKEARLGKYEEALKEALHEALGERPSKPFRSGANPFLLYQKDHWFRCKAKCDEARRKATGNPEDRATRNEVRAALGLMWREAPEEEKKPYLNETENNKKNNTQAVQEFKKRLQSWDEAAEKFTKEWKEKNPSIPDEEEKEAMRLAEIEVAEVKRNRKLNGFMDDSDDD